MVEEKDLTIMKYIRTYETEERFLADKDSTSRGFRLKPTLYKYSDVDVESKILLETDNPRKHGDSTYMEIALSSDVEFSFYIGNKSGDTQTTMNCSIDWGDGTVETKTITKDDKGFKLSHNYVAGSYKIELYGVERDYSIPGDTTNYTSYISPLHSSVKRIVLCDSVVDIGEAAFNECESLISVYIPGSVNSIGEAAFLGCISLTSVYISEGVTSIGKYAFNTCDSLTSIHIPERVTSIEYGAFGVCPILTSVYIPGSVNSIGNGAFFQCTSLTSVYISEGVVNIEATAFAVCYSLTSVYIPDSVTTIGDDAFHDCTSLTSINIPESVTSIGDWVFQNCSSLTSINIPEGITIINQYTFYNCSSLISISSPNTTAPTLGNSVFTKLPANGILHVKPGATGYDAWLSKLPSGWTIVEDL